MYKINIEREIYLTEKGRLLVTFGHAAGDGAAFLNALFVSTVAHRIGRTLMVPILLARRVLAPVQKTANGLVFFTGRL